MYGENKQETAFSLFSYFLNTKNMCSKQVLDTYFKTSFKPSFNSLVLLTSVLSETSLISNYNIYNIVTFI